MLAALLAGCAAPDPTTRPLQLEMVTPHRSAALAACIAERWQGLSAPSNVTIRQQRTATGYAVSATAGFWAATQAVAQVDICDEGSTTRYFKNPAIGPDFDAALRACLK